LGFDEAGDGYDAVERGEAYTITRCVSDYTKDLVSVGRVRETHKLPKRNIRQIAIFCVLSICNLSTLDIGIVRIQMSPKRLMMPTPR